MRAALLAAVREPFVVEDIDYLDPAPGRVLVRTGASPFCSTDCVNWRGELFKIPPTILGHASMGEVLELGAGVDHIKLGDRVIVPGTSECGVCFYCSIGRPDQCSETFDRGGILNSSPRQLTQSVEQNGEAPVRMRTRQGAGSR